MMISDADFEDLFPDTFKAKPKQSVSLAAEQPATRRALRWKDAEGRKRHTVLFKSKGKGRGLQPVE